MKEDYRNAMHQSEKANRTFAASESKKRLTLPIERYRGTYVEKQVLEIEAKLKSKTAIDWEMYDGAAIRNVIGLCMQSAKRKVLYSCNEEDIHRKYRKYGNQSLDSLWIYAENHPERGERTPFEFLLDRTHMVDEIVADAKEGRHVYWEKANPRLLHQLLQIAATEIEPQPPVSLLKTQDLYHRSYDFLGGRKLGGINTFIKKLDPENQSNSSAWVRLRDYAGIAPPTHEEILDYVDQDGIVAWRDIPAQTSIALLRQAATEQEKPVYTMKRADFLEDYADKRLEKVMKKMYYFGVNATERDGGGIVEYIFEKIGPVDIILDAVEHGEPVRYDLLPPYFYQSLESFLGVSVEEQTTTAIVQKLLSKKYGEPASSPQEGSGGYVDIWRDLTPEMCRHVLDIVGRELGRPREAITETNLLSNHFASFGGASLSSFVTHFRTLDTWPDPATPPIHKIRDFAEIPPRTANDVIWSIRNEKMPDWEKISPQAKTTILDKVDGEIDCGTDNISTLDLRYHGYTFLGGASLAALHEHYAMRHSQEDIPALDFLKRETENVHRTTIHKRRRKVMENIFRNRVTKLPGINWNTTTQGLLTFAAESAEFIVNTNAYLGLTRDAVARYIFQYTTEYFQDQFIHSSKKYLQDIDFHVHDMLDYEIAHHYKDQTRALLFPEQPDQPIFDKAAHSALSSLSPIRRRLVDEIADGKTFPQITQTLQTDYDLTYHPESLQEMYEDGLVVMRHQLALAA